MSVSSKFSGVCTIAHPQTGSINQRKCWWDGVEVDVPVEDGSNQTANVKVWARRVWTLELSLI